MLRRLHHDIPRDSKVIDELALGSLLVATDEEFLPEMERALGATMPPADARAPARAMAQWFARSEMGPITATTARLRS